MKPYRLYSPRALLSRLRAYRSYVDCGCYKPRPNGRCAGESNCARADYAAVVRALGEKVGAP